MMQSTKAVAHHRVSLVLVAMAVWSVACAAAGVHAGKPLTAARCEQARNDELRHRVATLVRTNAEVEREARYYDTDAGREKISRDNGWVRANETPILFYQ